MKLTSYDDTLYPIYDIDLTAPPEIRWKHVAEKESKNIGRLLDDVTKLCGNRVADFPLAVQPVVIALGKPAGTLAGWLVNMVAGMFGQEYVTEIRAIAKHSGQPLSHVMLGNLTYDFCQMAGIVGLGCSSYSCNVAEVPTLVGAGVRGGLVSDVPREMGRHDEPGSDRRLLDRSVPVARAAAAPECVRPDGELQAGRDGSAGVPDHDELLRARDWYPAHPARGHYGAGR